MEPEYDSTRFPDAPLARTRDRGRIRKGAVGGGNTSGGRKRRKQGPGRSCTAAAMRSQSGRGAEHWEEGGHAPQSTLKPTDGVMGGYGDPGSQHRDPSRPSPTARWGGGPHRRRRRRTPPPALRRRRCLRRPDDAGGKHGLKNTHEKNWVKNHTMK